jgi:hypothetical protein
VIMIERSTCRLSYGVNRIYTVTLEKNLTPKPKRPPTIATIRESYSFDLETGG